MARTFLKIIKHLSRSNIDCCYTITTNFDAFGIVAAIGNVLDWRISLLHFEIRCRSTRAAEFLSSFMYPIIGHCNNSKEICRLFFKVKRNCLKKTVTPFGSCKNGAARMLSHFVSLAIRIQIVPKCSTSFLRPERKV